MKFIDTYCFLKRIPELFFIIVFISSAVFVNMDRCLCRERSENNNSCCSQNVNESFFGVPHQNCTVENNCNCNECFFAENKYNYNFFTVEFKMNFINQFIVIYNANSGNSKPINYFSFFTHSKDINQRIFISLSNLRI